MATTMIAVARGTAVTGCAIVATGCDCDARCEIRELIVRGLSIQNVSLRHNACICYHKKTIALFI